MQPLSRGPSPCSSLALFSTSSGSVFSAGHVRARNPCITVLRRYDRGDLFISSRSRSVRGHRRWLRYGRFHTRSRAVRLLGRALSDRPPYHWTAIRGSGAGHDVTLALAHLSITEEWWRESFAVLGAIAVGGTAWAHVSMQTDTALRPGAAPSPIQPPNGATIGIG